MSWGSDQTLDYIFDMRTIRMSPYRFLMSNDFKSLSKVNIMHNWPIGGQGAGILRTLHAIPLT